MAATRNFRSVDIVSAEVLTRDLAHPTGVLLGARWRIMTGALLVACGLLSSTANAESLKDAMASAYLTNPQLKAQRASLRAVDENVARANSGYRPTVSGQADHSTQDVKTRPDYQDASGMSNPRSYAVGISQPLFQGFRTINAVRGAEAEVEAGREDLRTMEQQVLLAAAQTYLDVVRDLTIVALKENNVKVLAEQLKATENRFQVGEVTKTDVAQSTASLSGGQSDLALSQATLQISRANFERVVGHSPRQLTTPEPIDRALPNSLERAIQTGGAENPTIIAAIYRERAQDHAIEEARGELLPTVSLNASYTAGYDPAHGTKEQDVGLVTGRITVPLYQAGEVGARIRQNVEMRSQLRQVIDQTRQQVTANVTTSWSQVTSIRSQILANKAQVDANSIALSGVREEEKVGQRTVLDVLNAQQALLNSQVTLEMSKHDLGVASYSLVAAIGHLTSGDLALSVAQYDPSKHYKAVKNKWSDWDWSAHTEPSDETARSAKNGQSWSTQIEPMDEAQVGPIGVPAKGKRNKSGPAYQQ
jgi:outer membrane protein